jgi:hypothetical protein
MLKPNPCRDLKQKSFHREDREVIKENLRDPHSFVVKCLLEVTHRLICL